MFNAVTLLLNIFLYICTFQAVALCFSFARRSSLFASSNPLKLSLRLSVSPIVRPSLTLLVYGGSSFYSSCLPTFPFSSPYHSHLSHQHPPPISPNTPPFALPHSISSCCLYSYSTCRYLLILLLTCCSTGDKNYSLNS